MLIVDQEGQSNAYKYSPILECEDGDEFEREMESDSDDEMDFKHEVDLELFSEKSGAISNPGMDHTYASFVALSPRVKGILCSL